MAASKFDHPAQAEADRLLEELADTALILARTEEDLAAELEEMKKLSPIWGIQAAIHQENKERLQHLEKQLLTLMKKAKADIFPERAAPGSDRVDLPHGALFHSLAEKIRKAKTITWELLEEKGFPEAVKIVKSVDWDALQDWPDARLFLIGTERKPVEEFAWELKGAGAKGEGAA